jgi:general secretion pathway protein K
VNLLRDRNGIAVLITLTVLALLVVTAMELNRKAVSSVEYTGAVRNRVILASMASSGIRLGMGLLVKDKNETGEVDSLQEEWADAGILEELVQEFSFEEGAVTLAISDELSRIQINALVAFPEGQASREPQVRMLERLVGYVKAEADGLDDDDTAPTALSSSIKDWIDRGDNDAISGVSGAESDYYQGQDPPYACPNSPIRHINELLLIKGWQKLVDAVGGISLMAQYMTVHGMTDQDGKKYTFPGRININTAEAPVLAALMPDSEKVVQAFQLAQDLLAYRDETADGQFLHQDLKDVKWYQKAPGLADITIEPELLTTQSDFFRVVATAELHASKLTTTAVVKREKEKKTGKWRCRVLSWTSE